MPDHSHNNSHYVFQVIREDIVRTEIIKATSQDEAERILTESDPKCTYKFLWIQKRSRLEKQPKNTWLWVFLIFAGIFTVIGFALMLMHLRSSRYFFIAGFIWMFAAVSYEWWRNWREQ